MTKKDLINTIQFIHNYARGRLRKNEAEKLWKEFMKEPELLKALEIEVCLLKIFDDIN
ncbi:hypothetical protein [Gracilimonas halophila]|uniref:Uncharacterized protein n=1 Tax=Gracilimonas halophila TaxID=1834464 RepID=A0ABW5JGI5_9BACT